MLERLHTLTVVLTLTLRRLIYCFAKYTISAINIAILLLSYIPAVYHECYGEHLSFYRTVPHSKIRRIGETLTMADSSLLLINSSQDISVTIEATKHRK